MSLSDYEKCWNTPCTCGWYYRKYSVDAKMELVSAVLGDVPKSLLEQIRNAISKDKESDVKPPYRLYEVQWYESERGWGQQYSHSKYFVTLDGAKQHIKKEWEDKDRSGPVPDWYLFPMEPKLVEVQRDLYLRIIESTHTNSEKDKKGE